MRNIKDIKIAKKKNTIIFEISANAFLFNMVRIIMGTLINFGANNLDPNLMKSILDSKDRKKASKTLDSSGLYFIGPEYPVEFKIPRPPKKRQIVPYI
jgi:tRNA pseudouridine38-40 synthase